MNKAIDCNQHPAPSFPRNERKKSRDKKRMIILNAQSLMELQPCFVRCGGLREGWSGIGLGWAEVDDE